MIFSKNINKICKMRGVTLSKLCEDLGISLSKVTAINTGSIPKEEMMLKFARYLNCSLKDFFDEDDYVVDKNDETEILQIFRKLDRRSKHEFMSILYDFEKTHLH